MVTKSKRRKSSSSAKGKANRVRKAISPLSWFRRRAGESRLAKVAEQMANVSFDPRQLRAEIRGKLKRLSYPQPPERRTGLPTFYDRLKRAGAVRTLLSDDTLREVWSCLQIPRIVSRDRELEKRRESVVGRPLKFHLAMLTEMQRHITATEALAREFGAAEWVESYLEPIRSQFRDNAWLCIQSRWKKGFREELLSGQPKSQLEHAPWDELVAARVALYWILWTRLHEKAEMSDRFLRQLSLLIFAPSDIPELEEAAVEALRVAIKDDRPGWRKRLGISKKT